MEAFFQVSVKLKLPIEINGFLYVERLSSSTSDSSSSPSSSVLSSLQFHSRSVVRSSSRWLSSSSEVQTHDHLSSLRDVIQEDPLVSGRACSLCRLLIHSNLHHK